LQPPYIDHGAIIGPLISCSRRDDPQMDTLVMGWREDIRRLREIL